MTIASTVQVTEQTARTCAFSDSMSKPIFAAVMPLRLRRGALAERCALRSCTLLSRKRARFRKLPCSYECIHKRRYIYPITNTHMFGLSPIEGSPHLLPAAPTGAKKVPAWKAEAAATRERNATLLRCRIAKHKTDCTSTPN